MKNVFIFLILFASSLLANAQTQNISIEAFGAHNTVGINYDSRLKGNQGWGYRVGIGYSYSGHSNFLVGSSSIKGVAIPAEINYLVGQRKSKLELGFGMSLGYYQEKYSNWVPSSTGLMAEAEGHHKTFGYFLFGNVGYRFQPVRGLMFRLGITPSFNFGDRYGLSRSEFYPYVSLGWTL
jgi:hypothetical protein